MDECVKARMRRNRMKIDEAIRLKAERIKYPTVAEGRGDKYFFVGDPLEGIQWV